MGVSKTKVAAVAPASEVEQVEEQNVSTSEVGLVTLSLDEYLNEVRVNVGLLASFKYEATRNGATITARTKEEWDASFFTQSRKVYL